MLKRALVIVELEVRWRSAADPLPSFGYRFRLPDTGHW